MANYTTAWDETVPTGIEDISQGDNRIIEVKTCLRERLATEHAAITGTSGDALLAHLPGRCSICYIGTTAQIAALASPPNTALAFDTDLGCFKYRTGGAWVPAPFDWDNIFTGGDASHSHVSAAEGGLLTNPTYLDPPVNLVATANFCDWTNVDITAQTTPSVAKSALIQVDITMVGAAGSAKDCKATAYFRAKGQGGADGVLSRAGVFAKRNIGVAPCGRFAGQLWVPVDSDEIFQYKVVDESDAPQGFFDVTKTTNIDLIAYSIF